MAQRIVKDDHIKVISGPHKGTTGKVLAVMPNKGVALIEGLGEKTRHVKANQLSPRGTTRDIHVGISLHKLALIVDTKQASTSRVGYIKNADGAKVRLARQAKNKEIK